VYFLAAESVNAEKPRGRFRCDLLGYEEADKVGASIPVSCIALMLVECPDIQGQARTSNISFNILFVS
jgi:hypothetical protein